MRTTTILKNTGEIPSKTSIIFKRLIEKAVQRLFNFIGNIKYYLHVSKHIMLLYAPREAYAKLVKL